MSTLSFFGAAGIVTGSCSLLDTGRVRVLIDCGLFQGNKSVTKLNAEPFPFDASAVDVVLLTHAHTDHSGLLPKLIKAGFAGEIHATAPTVDLLEFMMADSARIQQSDAERQNRRRKRRGKAPVEPLFTVAHADEALKRLRPVEYGTWIAPVDGVEARYQNAGHILGSASIELRYPEVDADASDAGSGGARTMRLLFSGDLGPDEKTFHAEPGGDTGFDYVISESTYGDRERDDYTLDGRRAAMKAELVAGLGRGGNVVIPCFAVERSQELLHDIGVMLARGELPEAKTVYLDSPLAGKVTDVFMRHAHTLEDVELPERGAVPGPAFAHRRERGRLQGDRRRRRRRDHHLGERHGRRRARRPPPEEQHLENGGDGAVRRLPVAGHDRRAHPLRRAGRVPARQASQGAREHPPPRQLLGARRSLGAPRLDSRARADRRCPVPQPRRRRRARVARERAPRSAGWMRRSCCRDSTSRSSSPPARPPRRDAPGIGPIRPPPAPTGTRPTPTSCSRSGAAWRSSTTRGSDARSSSVSSPSCRRRVRSVPDADRTSEAASAETGGTSVSRPVAASGLSKAGGACCRRRAGTGSDGLSGSGWPCR